MNRLMLISLCGLLAHTAFAPFGNAGTAQPATQAVRTAVDARASTVNGEVLPPLHFDLVQHTLPNGLRVIMLEDHHAPIVSLALMVEAGSANEQPGHTGFAHLFEHLMFQGSRHVAPVQHIKLIESVGGFSDATTGDDWTAFFDSVPANQLPLALYLNADRLESLDISAPNLAREKEVVKEELRLRFDNQPYQGSRFKLNQLLYDRFAYGHNGAGSMRDIDAASLEEVRSFFAKYYVASNLVLVLVGDFRTPDALHLIERYFEALPLRKRPPRPDLTELPQRAERRERVLDPLAPLPLINMAFKTLPGDRPDDFALEVLATVLAGGDSSRLHEVLVERDHLATEVSADADTVHRGTGALYLEAMPRSVVGISALELALDAEIARVRLSPVSDAELEKAKSMIAVQYLNSLHRSLLRAFRIGQFSADFDDPGLINTYLDRIGAVTAKDIQQVARKYLRPDNRTVVITVPKLSEEKRS